MNWTSLRKGSTGLHVATGVWYSNNLRAENSRARVVGRTLEISLDLSPNLRGRNQSSNSVIDARELAGRIHELSLLQVHERQILEGLHHLLNHHEAEGPGLILVVVLERSHRFRARLKESGGVGLSFEILGPA